MFGAEAAARQGAGRDLAVCFVRDRSPQIRAIANPGLYPRVGCRRSISPDLGCPPSRTMLLRFKLSGTGRATFARPPPEGRRPPATDDVYPSARTWGPGKMGSLIVPRRRFLQNLASATVCSPAVVRASSLMAVSAKFSSSVIAAPPPWATTQEALALLQRALECRFAETLFGQEGLSAEAEGAVPAFSPVVAESRMTALWELRTWFGPRGSPPKPFEELPAGVQAALVSMFGA